MGGRQGRRERWRGGRDGRSDHSLVLRLEPSDRLPPERAAVIRNLHRLVLPDEDVRGFVPLGCYKVEPAKQQRKWAPPDPLGITLVPHQLLLSGFCRGIAAKT